MSASDTPTGSLYIQEIVQLRNEVRAREAVILGLAAALTQQLVPKIRPEGISPELAWSLLENLEKQGLLPKGFLELNKR